MACFDLSKLTLASVNLLKALES